VKKSQTSFIVSYKQHLKMPPAGTSLKIDWNKHNNEELILNFTKGSKFRSNSQAQESTLGTTMKNFDTEDAGSGIATLEK
jgi:hypothetical protein